MAETIKTITLTNSEISAAISDMELWMKEMQIERKNAVRLNLSMEEILLRWQEHFGSDTPVSVTIRRKFGTLTISVSLKGEAWDPTDTEQEDEYVSNQLLEKLGLSPQYSYKKGNNIITLRLSRQKKNSAIYLLSAIFSALLLGILGLQFAPDLSNSILKQILLPVRSTLLNILIAVAVPAVFFSVIQGVTGIGDIANFGRIGKRMMLRIIVKTALFTALAGLIMLPLFSPTLSGNSGISGVGDALQMVLNIFPATFVDPFSSGNALQAIVIALAVGLAILALDTRVDGIKNIFGQLNSLFQILMEWVSKTVPALVFLLILEVVWSGSGNMLIGLWKPLLLITLLCLVMIFIEVVTVCVKLKVSPFLLVKKILPENIIAFITSCAMATYSVTAESCKEDLGIPKKIMNFGLPIGLVTYMPGISVYYLMILFYGLEQYNLDCSWNWLLIAWISVTLLAIATPPVSGGSMACFAVLFHQMGIPTEAIAFSLAMNVLAERICTVADLSMLELELVLVSDKAHQLNKEALRSKKKKRP